MGQKVTIKDINDSIASEHYFTSSEALVGQMSGSTHTGVAVGANGQIGTVVTVTLGKTGYLCSDGVTYWR